MILKNNKIQIRISKSTGRITHIALNPEFSSRSDDKGAIFSDDINPLGLTGIGYALFVDEKYQFDAWNIHPEYRNKPISFPPVSEILIEESGPLRVTILFKYSPTQSGSTIHTRISLVHDDPKIYGELLIDWQEEYKLLKLALDTRLDSDRVFCGSPYYIQSRTTIPRTTYEEAQFEFAFQQFAFLPGVKANFGNITGIVMYSQSKFGMYARGGLMEMSLLKAPHFEPPDLKYATLDSDAPQGKIVDRGFHHIPWAVEFVSPAKSLLEIVRTAYEYNNPLIALETDYAHDPQSFLSINAPNVLLSTVKEIEIFLRDAPDWFYQPGMGELPFIIRCVEMEGNQVPCTIQLSPRLDIKRVQEVDLLERIRENGIEKSDVVYSNHNITFMIHPYEIKSIMVIGRIPLE
jgi:alpha-mannosidase